MLAPFVVLLALLVLAAGMPDTAQAGCHKSGKSVSNMSKKTARDAIVCLFNKGRSAKNLNRNGKLKTAAQGHASVMASQHCFSHQCPGEPSLKDRVARTGYLSGASGYELGEVIINQRDKASPRRIARKWLDSPSHSAIIRKSTFDHVGVGLSIRGGFVWAAADFGHR